MNGLEDEEGIMATINITRFRNAIQRDIKNFGLLNTATDYLFRAVNQVMFFSVFRTMAVNRPNPLFTMTDKKYECRFLNAEEIRAFPRRPEVDMSREFVQAALEKGDQCYAILDGDFLASYGWYSNEPTRVNDELRVRFDHEHVYMYNTFTHPTYRGQRLQAVGMTLALIEFLKQGFHGIVFCVEENNHRSLRSVRRGSAKDFGRVTVFKLFGDYLIYHSSGCQGYGFTIYSVQGLQPKIRPACSN